ncbi:tryptophan synthase, alpha subunit [Thermaerobacter marianensis DSM 12885]|uniref:Tryptophan synthase alpha chain n=1 Tax=Thermaerobacter marianensis (strain ATCC 700841 / DSM 12885 / JCM 10246 / 7p75a) TaxID=644966 RepID=E6SMS1_THEM7|nr:tryptophan synthase subunit alpha [Thermaerobacter marianensis]ADU51563.1 tryptophan synthase, alpha subunit [Thermaerobacter marianensis DSM 12885]
MNRVNRSTAGAAEGEAGGSQPRPGAAASRPGAMALGAGVPASPTAVPAFANGAEAAPAGAVAPGGTVPEPVNRLDDALARARAEGRAALIVYVTAGHPGLEATRQLVPALFAAGADVVELGMPFSDPLADGPTIQRSTQHALARGVRLGDVLDLVRDLRAGGVDGALVLLTYANPLLARGLLDEPAPLAAAGFDGVIIPDLPLVERGAADAAFRAAGLHLIPMVAPTSSPEHVRQATAGRGGFVYCVSVTGVTGARKDLPEELPAWLDRVRAAGPRPVAIGFGVAGPEQARALAAHADAVIVGSALVDRIEAAAGGAADPVGKEEEYRIRAVVDAATSFVAALRQAVAEAPS